MDKRIEDHIIQQYYDNQNLYRSLKHDITDIIENINAFKTQALSVLSEVHAGLHHHA